MTKELAAATHDSVAHFAEVIFVNAFENQSWKLAVNLGRVKFLSKLRNRGMLAASIES